MAKDNIPGNKLGKHSGYSIRYFSVLLSVEYFQFADNPVLIRWLSLVVLIFQTAAFVLVMRYSRTRLGDLYISTTAVVMAEATKLTFCLVVTFCEHRCNICSWLRYLNEASK